LIAQGEDQAVRQLEAWLNQGPELATVAEVASSVVSLSEQYETFNVS